jgi:hypothetical protein
MQYLINQHAIARLKSVATRLYSENRMTGDEMRDLAQAVDSVRESALPYFYEETGSGRLACSNKLASKE